MPHDQAAWRSPLAPHAVIRCALSLYDASNRSGTHLARLGRSPIDLRCVLKQAVLSLCVFKVLEGCAAHLNRLLQQHPDDLMQGLEALHRYISSGARWVYACKEQGLRRVNVTHANDHIPRQQGLLDGGAALAHGSHKNVNIKIVT